MATSANVITGVPAPTPFLQSPGEPPVSWSNWILTFENYLLAVGLDEKTQEARCRALLISCLGCEGQRIVFTFEKSAIDTLDTLKTSLKNYFVGITSKWTYRVKFSERRQRINESIESFTADLRQIASKCEFAKVTDPMNEALLGQFIIGVTDVRVREKLLLADDSSLTFKKAVETAKEYERVTKDSSMMNQRTLQNQANNTVNQISRSRDKSRTPKKPGSYVRSSSGNNQRKCYRCGGESHLASDPKCPARDKACNSCKKIGHYGKMCRSRNQHGKSEPQEYRDRNQRCNNVNESTADACSVTILSTDDSNSRQTKIFSSLKVNNCTFSGIIDTGASVSIFPLHLLHKVVPSKHVDKLLEPCGSILSTFSGQKLQVVGKLTLRCMSPDELEEHEVPFVVTKEGKDVLLEVDAIRRFESIRKDLCQLEENEVRAIDDLLENVEDRSTTVDQQTCKELGKIEGFVHKVRIDNKVRPIRQSLRQIPFALRDKVKQEIQRLVEADVIEKVEASSWTSNVVIVQKKDGRIRLCVDMRAANKAVITDGFPIPRIEELLHSMKNAVMYSKIDLSEAYLQLSLLEDSRDLTTFIVPDGLYRFKRCPFGLASCPSAFQAVMSKILENIPGVVCYLDDILVSGPSSHAHEERLMEVLKRLEKHNVKINKGKCIFRSTKMSYLGHEVDQEGIRPSPEKVKALLKAPAPTSSTELRTVLGAFGYYSKYIPDFSTLIEPLRKLVNTKEFEWNEKEQDAFRKLKNQISSSSALAPFDSNLPVIVATDASNVGLGATLSVMDPVLGRRTVEFASRRLSESERKFSTTEKESLALIWACEKWRPYLIGRRFVLETDHEPLRLIFSAKGFDRMSLRLARWAVRLMAFSFEIRYKRGSENVIPDFCSRFPVEDQVCCLEEGEEEEEDAFLLDSVPIGSFRSESERCPELSQIRQYLTHKWPGKEKIPPDLMSYFQVREELSLHQNHILRGRKVIVPVSLRPKVIDLAHECHQGIQRTKTRIRSQFWWPKLDCQVEEAIKVCVPCTETSKTFKGGPSPSSEKLPLPNRPWDRIAVDIKGPMYHLPQQERYAIVIIDLNSKWPEVAFTASVETAKVIETLRFIFNREGLPHQLVSDNGVQFTSNEFQDFLQENYIEHIRTPLYNPESNSVVERFNRTLSEQIEIAMNQHIPIKRYIQAFLQNYRATPHASTLASPSILLHGREMRTRLDMFTQPRTRKKVTFENSFKAGDKVCLKHPRTKKIHRNLVVKEAIGSKSVILNNGEKWHTRNISKDYSNKEEDQTLSELPNSGGHRGTAFERAEIEDQDASEDSRRADGDGTTAGENGRRADGDGTTEGENGRRSRFGRRVMQTRDPNFVYY